MTKIAGLILLFLLPGTQAFADELTVDRTTVQLDESVTITVSLSGSFASADNVTVPVQNLIIDGPPAVSSQFSWINGSISRSKIYRFTARPKAPGAALAGPLALTGDDGQIETLAPVSLQVLPDSAAGSNDPLTIFRQLLATHRDPIFVVAQADRTSVMAGEEIVVTWTVYNAASVQQWQISDLPKLEDFWTEELDSRNEQPSQEILGDQIVQKLVVRRAALFPLRSGTLTIAPLGIEAVVMRRIDTGGFGIFEGSTVGVTRRSAQLTIQAMEPPAGSASDVVGDVSIHCGRPAQSNGGPVAFDVALAGRANLRSAAPPQLDGSVSGTVQSSDAGLTVERQKESASMTRRWHFLIFPSGGGRFVIPPVIAQSVTSDGARHELRCEAQTIEVTAAAAAPPQTGSPAAVSGRPGRLDSIRMSPVLIRAGIGAFLLLIAAFAIVPRIRRQLRLTTEVRALMQSAAGLVPDESAPAARGERLTAESPKTIGSRPVSQSSGIRGAVDAMIERGGRVPRVLAEENSEEGDAYRALLSLLSAAERERFEVHESEIEERIREVIKALRPR